MSKIIVLNQKGKYHDPLARETLIAYITRSSKTPSGFIGYVGVTEEAAVENMDTVAETFGKTKGVQLLHITVSFHPKEDVEPYEAYVIATDFCRELGKNYQCVYAVHEDKDHVHFHVVMNHVSYVDGHKYSGKKKEFYPMMNTLNDILHEHGLHEAKYQPNKTRK